jgi:SAM-dependent methyltransferase
MAGPAPSTRADADAPPQAHASGGAGAGEPKTGDMAGRSYWERVWDETSLPAPVDPNAAGLRHHVRREFHDLFGRHLPPKGAPPARLLEVGCARSAWLPYFAREFACEVTGLDYSPLGCRQSEEVLRRAGVEGEVVCADMFAPPDRLKGSFDFVVTFGVVEHFDDTAAALAALAAFLRPGGRLITVIPNMTAAVGWLQRVINRPVFDLHVPLDAAQLGEAHRNAGLEVERCAYLVSSHFAVANLNGVPKGPGYAARQALRGALVAASVAFWAWEERVRAVRPGRVLSPYAVCVARRGG